MGPLRRDVVFSRNRRALHVFALEPDLRSPAAGAPVALYGRDAKAGGPMARLRSERTDAGGYVRFGDLEPGMYVACAPGARPEDGVPHSASVVLPPRTGPNESALTVQVPARRYRVVLDVLAEIEDTAARRGGGARMFLVRVDDGAGRQVPIRERIVPGEQHVSLSLEPGKYAVGVVPQGELLPVEGTSQFQVLAKDGQRFEVWLAANKETTEVRLDFSVEGGRHPTWFPVAVYLRGTEDVVEDWSDHLFLGPHRWRSGSQQVQVVPGAGHLVVVSPEGTWMSREAVALKPPRTTVPLARASRLKVVWVAQAGRAVLDPYLRVVAGRLEQTTSLRWQLIHERGRMGPGWTGRIVVPQGRVVVECRSRRDDRLLWTRELEARHAVSSLRIE